VIVSSNAIDFEFHLAPSLRPIQLRCSRRMLSGQSRPSSSSIKRWAKGGDAQHPLAHGAALDGETADLALAVHDFFIREHRAEFRAPVHWRGGDVSETARSISSRLRALRFEFG
jgi:hypothetical protein